MKKIIQPIWIFYFGVILSAFLAPNFANAQSVCNPSLFPTVYTGGATNITKNSVTFSGSVNSPVDYWSWFEYSTNNFTNAPKIGFESHRSNVSIVSADLRDLQPSTTYYYRILAKNSYCDDRIVMGNAMSFKTHDSASGQAPLVYTNAISSVVNDSVTLSGTVNPNYNYTTAWFEYGTSYQLEYLVGYQGVGSWGDNQTIYAYLQNLSPNVTYYYRIIAQSSQGMSYGSILTFTNQLIPSGTVPSIPPAASIPVQPTLPTQPSIFNIGSTVKKSAPRITNETIFLDPSVDNQNLSAGQEITYILNYKNIGKSSVKNASLKIVLPGEVQYQSSNLKSVSIGNNLSFNLGTINPQEQGTINVKIKIKNLTRGGSALMFASTLNYNDSSGNLRSVDSYLAVIIKESASVTASLLDVIGSLVNSLFFDLLLGLALGYGIYNFFVRSKDTDLAS